MERIADHALLSNGQGSALVSLSGSIDWACLPAFDSPAAFARILGAPGGFWSISPATVAETTREYVEDTMVLRTEFRTPSGVAVLTDFLPLHPDDTFNDIGLHSPSCISRVVEGISGVVEFDVELALRPEFGLTTPLVRETEPGVWRTRGGPLNATLTTDAEMRSENGVLYADLEVRAGEHACFAMYVSDPWHDAPKMLGADDVLEHREITVHGWQTWAQKLIGYEGEYRGMLRRSAVVLRSLNYSPTGA